MPGAAAHRVRGRARAGRRARPGGAGGVPAHVDPGEDSGHLDSGDDSGARAARDRAGRHHDLGQLASIAGAPPTGCAGDPACIGIFLPKAIPTYVGCPEINCEARYAEASPLTHVSASTAPMFIANSQDELIPLQQPQEMIAALQRFGVPNQLDILPGELHAEEYASQVMPPTVSFLQRYLEPPVAPAEVSRSAPGGGGDDHLPWIVGAAAVLVVVMGLMAVVAAGARRRRA